METVSEVHPASSSPPMMTMVSPWAQLLESPLFAEIVRGRVTQPPCCTFHCTQVLRVDESHPPHNMLPAWTWYRLSSGSEGSWHEVLLQVRNTSVVCLAPFPPVIRMAAKIKKIDKPIKSVHKLV